MSREIFSQRLRDVFSERSIAIHHNFVQRADASQQTNQQHTNEAFSEKWQKYEASDEKERLFQFQRDWYLRLYGFDTEVALATFLASKDVIFDAGCGLGYKAAWFAKLAPRALVIGMDFSDAAGQAAKAYRELENLFFIQGDIAHTGLREGSVDYVSCDQVIMHTEDPAMTFAELARVTTRDGGEFACYFYAKKALPRELLDDYFRHQCKKMERQDLWVMSEQLTELGKRLSALDVAFDCPDIPELGIKGGRYDIQRFIYWNFLKCFWNEELGIETSVVTNFDWYSLSNARRFSEKEVRDIVAANSMIETFFHGEEACYSGRFTHTLRTSDPVRITNPL
jgi:ubiquinone/menaquinone biosynthesis C-methylase UbiE